VFPDTQFKDTQFEDTVFERHSSRHWWFDSSNGRDLRS